MDYYEIQRKAMKRYCRQVYEKIVKEYYYKRIIEILAQKALQK